MPKTWLSCQKPKSGFHANKTKTWLSCQKSKNLASMPTKQNLVFKKKTWLLCHKIWLSHQTNKNRLPCHKTKFGSHATKSLASMPQNQNLAFTPQKSALMPKTGFHATNKILALMPPKFGFHAISKNQAFRHKIRLSCPKQPFDKRFSQNDNLLIKISNKHSHPTFSYFHQKGI